ncbi:MAG: RNA polymerase sigma factor [Polyangiaceae bacterium]|nr:RNA polymerase sigma factor [Polyangiaceae bacterium]
MLIPTPTTESLVSFEQAFRDHAPYVWRLLKRLGVHPDDVEDVCQEVFLVVHRKLHTYHGGSTVRTWIYGICTRVASEYKRRPYHRRETPTADLPDEPADVSPEAKLDQKRALLLLDRALDKLDHDKRAVFVLFEIEELSMADVAAALQCPLQTAYARLYAARKQVQSELKGRVDLPAPANERSAP